MLIKSFRRAAGRLLKDARRSSPPDDAPKYLLSAGYQTRDGHVAYTMAIREKDGRFHLCTVDQQSNAAGLEHQKDPVPLGAALAFLDRFEMDCRSRRLAAGEILHNLAVNGPHAYFRDYARQQKLLVGHEAFSRYHTRKVKSAFDARQRNRSPG